MNDLVDELKKIKAKTLMVVFPHPDDESMMTGGLLCLAHKFGLKTVVVTLTKGDAGKLFIHPRGRSTSDVRQAELKSAAKTLCVDKLLIGSFSDGKLKGEKSKWSVWLKKIIKENNPDLIVTYDHSGLTGHPDHIVLSQELLKIVKTKRNTELYWVCLNDKLKKWFVPDEVSHNFQKPSHVIDTRDVWFSKWRAIKAHKSQRYAQIRLTFPLWIFLSKYHYEWYHKVDLKKTYKHKFIDFEIWKSTTL